MNLTNTWSDYVDYDPQSKSWDLTNVRAVAVKLDLLKPNAKVITITGTNGKGSTVAVLEAIYTTAGYQVGAYTSPHLLMFNERIRINQKPIPDEALQEALLALEKARGDTPLSYFESATLAALWYFKKFPLDVMILEVGMGGRLDATNIVDADLAIITTVDLDHQAFLGDTKEAIGFEKAGILRPNRPYIYADSLPPPQSLLKYAESIQAVRLPCVFQLTAEKLQVTVSNNEQITLPVPVIHAQAAAAAVVCSDGLRDVLPVTQNHWSEAIRQVRLPGRQQVVEGPVTTIYDVAHNPQSVHLLADFLQHYPCTGKIHAVFSGLKDKDLCGLIKPMQAHVDFWYPALLTGARAASQSLLLESFPAEEKITFCYDNPWSAYQAAQARVQLGDVIVVYGSFLTVGEVMTARQMQEENEYEICNG